MKLQDVLLNKRERKFRSALQRINRTEDGKLVFKLLQEDLVTLSALSSDPNMVYYNLGQHDFMRSLLVAANVDVKELKINFEESLKENE